MEKVNDGTLVPVDDEIVIYQSEDGTVKVHVLFARETVWLTQERIATLFWRDATVIGKHIKNIYAEGELSPDTTAA